MSGHSFDRATALDIAKKYPPSRIGPTWRIEDGQWLLPEHSLGWEAISWIETYLKSPDGSGEPFTLTDEQARFVLWFYKLDPDGDFDYQRAVLQRLKGWGKDPLSAALSIFELAGPCRFSHWDEDGEAVGKQHPAPLVQVAAVSKEQIKSTLFSLFESIVPESTRSRYNLEVQREIIYAKGRGSLQTIGTNAQTAEGPRVTFFVAGEIHHWTTGNHGKQLYQTVFNNMLKRSGKSGGGTRILSITNAYQPGEESVLEDIRTSQQKVWDGLREADGTLYDSLEAHPDSPLDPEIAPYILRTIAGDAYWLYDAIDNVVRSFTDESIPPSRMRRMWYNQIVTSEESAFSASEVLNAIRPGTLGEIADLKRGDEITLGFDGSRRDDATALIAYRLRDNLVVPIQIWEKPDRISDWEIDRDDVDSVIHMAFQFFNVRAFYADVAEWESYITEWSDVYRERLSMKASSKSAVGWDMRGHKAEISALSETLMGMVRDGSLSLADSARLRAHFLNAELRYNRYGINFGKKGGRESPHKIDAMIATMLAVKAALDYRESASGKKRKRPGRIYQY